MSFFSRIFATLKKEPAVLLSLAGSGVAVAADFGLHLSAQQEKGVYGAVAAVTALLIRQSVTPNSAVNSRLTALESAVAALQPAAPAPASAPVADPGPTAGP